MIVLDNGPTEDIHERVTLSVQKLIYQELYILGRSPSSRAPFCLHICINFLVFLKAFLKAWKLISVVSYVSGERRVELFVKNVSGAA